MSLNFTLAHYVMQFYILDRDIEAKVTAPLKDKMSNTERSKCQFERYFCSS